MTIFYKYAMSEYCQSIQYQNIFRKYNIYGYLFKNMHQNMAATTSTIIICQSQNILIETNKNHNMAVEGGRGHHTSSLNSD